MTITTFNTPPKDLDDQKKLSRIQSQSIAGLLFGRSNNVIDFTATHNAASTTITDSRLGVNTVLLFMPTTANASAEIGAGTIYVSQSSRVNGSVVITHANNSQTDRVFKVVMVG